VNHSSKLAIALIVKRFIMSTICKMAMSAGITAVIPVLEAFLRDCEISFTQTSSKWPATSERSAFLPGEQFPSILSVKQITPQVTQIEFNSFSRLDDLASYLSAKIGTNVVVNIYQSVSTASYWALHSAGKCRRAIEAGDQVVYAQSGDRLPFERSEPGRAHDEDSEYIWFDHGEQDWYNREVGVPVEVYQEDEGGGWVNLMLKINDRASK
jgi:hypothetical protein